MAFTTTDGHTSGASAMRVEQGRMLYGLREIAAALHCSEKSVLRSPPAGMAGTWRGVTSVVTPSVKGHIPFSPLRRSNDFLPPLDTSPRFRHPDFPN